VRNFFTANAAYWISDYHFDGLRLDATQSIRDNGPHGTHIIPEIGRSARESAEPRSIVLIAENEPQDSCLIFPPEENGFGLDAVWNDDFHHSAVVALTSRSEAYFRDHFGHPQEFISCAKYGYLYQGQYYSWQSSHAAHQVCISIPLLSSLSSKTMTRSRISVYLSIFGFSPARPGIVL